MTTDYRALCAALVDAIDSGISTDRMHLSPVMLRARTLLDQPGPPELTRDELLRCAKIATPDYSNHWGRELEMMRAAITADRARRPKPPSLNEVALQMLGTIERDAHYLPEITDTIRRALEALDD